jgi:hypothetical protein
MGKEYEDRMYEFIDSLTPVAWEIIKESLSQNEIVRTSLHPLMEAFAIYLPILGEEAFKNPVEGKQKADLFFRTEK